MATIQGVYIALFGRPADPLGLAFFNTATNNGQNLSTIGNLAGTAEYQGRFTGQSNVQIINSIYQSLFGRDADVAGLTFFANQLATGRQTINTIAINILDGATGSDLTTVNNKEAAANLYTAALNTGTEIVAYSGTAAADAGRAFISGVTTTVPTAAAVDAAVLTMVTNSSSNPGATFALTANIDTLTGASGNDSFVGDVSFTDAAANATVASGTLGVADTLNGGAGTDTLSVTVVGGGANYTTGALPIGTLNSVETLNVRAIQTEAADIVTVNAAIPGLTAVNADRSTSVVSVTGLAAGASIGVIGNGAVANGAVNFAYAAANPAVTVNIVGGTTGTASNITNTDAASAVTTAVINSSGAANTVGILELDGDTAPDQITSLTINAASNLTVTLTADDFAATGSTMTVAGAAASVNVGGNFDGATINASGLTAGGLTVGLTANTTSFVGGQGNDVVTTAQLGGTVVASAINAGAGTADRLVVNAAAEVDTAAEAARFAGFEVLDAGAQALDLALFTNSSINALRVGGAANLSNVTSIQGQNVTQYASGDATIAVTGASTNGQIDTVRITADDGATAVNTIALGTPVLAGVENLQLVAVDNLSVTNLTSAASLTSITASGAGTISITTDALALAANTSVNASAATGAFTFDGSAATGNGIAVTGSATAANNITGTAQNDIIVGGTGIDTVVSTAGTDTINFGSDSAADVFNIATLTGRATITNFDAATSTTTEDLVNVSHNSVDGAEVVFTAAGLQVALTNDATYVVEQTVGTAGSLTTGGSVTLSVADFTAATLTNVAAYLTERFTTAANDQALVILNNGTNSYAYAINEGAADAGIQAAEVTLVGVFNGAVLNNADVFQTV